MKGIKKAIAGAIVGLLGALGTALVDDGTLTLAEFGGAVGAGLLAGVAVWRVENGLTDQEIRNLLESRRTTE